MHQNLKGRGLNLVLYFSLAVLIYFALYYYRLRLYSDTAQCIVNIVRTGKWATAHERFIVAINQWLPILLTHAGCSFKTIAIAYSFGHMLVPVMLALICMHWLKRPYHALAIVFMTVLMSVLLFYYAISELQMGLYLLLFYDALLDFIQRKGRRTLAFYILSPILLITIAFSHPMILLTMLGWLAFRWLKDRSDHVNTIISAVIFFAAYALKRIWFTPPYEVARMPGWEKLSSMDRNYFSGPFARSIYKYIVDDAFLMPIVLLATILILLYMRRYWLAALLPIAVLMIFTAVIVNFEDWHTQLYDQYYEHMLQPAVFFAALFSCFALERIQVATYWKAVAASVIIIISLVKIHFGHELLSRRQKWLYSYLSLMDNLGIKKAVLNRLWIPDGMVKGSFWSASFETLALSSLQGPDSSKTLYLSWDDAAHMKDPYYMPDKFITDSWWLEQKELPARWFRLGNQPYLILDNTVPLATLEHLRWL